MTFRLADSLPQATLDRLQAELPMADDAERRRAIERHLDLGLGSCLLRAAEHAEVVPSALLHFHQARYDLFSWVVMPNHVHVLLKVHQGHPLARIMLSLKSYTARVINQLHGRTGPVWQREYWDRFIRNDAHFARARAYIENNPVDAGLVKRPQDWPFSSAARLAADST